MSGEATQQGWTCSRRLLRIVTFLHTVNEESVWSAATWSGQYDEDAAWATGSPGIPPGHLLVDSAAGQALIGEAACVRWEQKLSDARLRGVRVHCKMMTPKRGRRCSTSHKIDDDAYCDRRTPLGAAVHCGRRRHPGTEHLCPEDHSQSLAALLLKNTGNSLRGERFGSSICEEDRSGSSSS